MHFLPIPKTIEPFVKNIEIVENPEEDVLHQLPFYADGFPGVVYSRSKEPFYLQPRGKRLSDFYLYGQTIEPISLDVMGAYRFYCIRMFPYAVRIFLGIDPKVLNDDCFNLLLLENVNGQRVLDQLNRMEDPIQIVEQLADFLTELQRLAAENPDYRIKLAINLILQSNGQMSIQEVRDRLYVGERTLERQFLRQVGVTPKQFARIIQFSSSIKQMTESDFLTLTEIAHDKGFADQSHFIRSFKRFAGKTPREFQKQISA